MTAAPGRPARHASQVGPLLLIGLGLLFLLNNLGVVPWAVWGSLWRLWPLLLVLLGLDLLLGGRVRGTLLGLGLATALVLGVVAAATRGAGTAAPPFSPAGDAISRSFSQPAQGATQANAIVRFGAGRLTVGTLERDQPDLLGTARYSGPESLLPEISVRRLDGVADLEYALRGTREGRFGPPFTGMPFAGGFFRDQPRPELQVLLSRDVPLTLSVQAGGAESDLDLSGLRLTRLDLNAGATATSLRLPSVPGTLPARIQGGASAVSIVVPPDVAAQIQFEGGLSTLDVDTARFLPDPDGGRRYRAPGYDAASSRVDLRIEAGAARVSVR